MGLPHSSQSMSVAIGPVGLGAAPLPPAPTIFAISSCERAPSSFSIGISASTCARSAPTSFFIIFVDRHFGNDEHPRNGPRLLSRSSIALPHFSHGTVVSIFVFGGSGRPSLSRLMIVSQALLPFSSLIE